MAAPSEDLPRLGRYQVINKIAAGGMAEVFLAKATGAMGFQRLVAVKLIHQNFTRDEDFVKMFIDEARIAMHLHHRNIVQVFDLDKADDTYFIAMEFVHGVNLYDLYERIASQNRWIEPSMALYLIAEISKGLHFAHTRSGADGRPLGIVHRDISPQNVLLSFEGEVKITDFGIATAAERLHQTAAGIVKGKYAYMAPERLQEAPTDGRVDVFSVGVLLYELLVGENPFAGASAVETIENVLSKEVPAPSSRGAPVTAGLDRITLKALARDPNQRYASAQDLADAVTEYALELTQARRDMAAGDAALAALLAELFPEKAKRALVSEAKAVSLPMGGVAVAILEPPPASNGARPSVSPIDPGTSQDLDEPTVLRMKPANGYEGDATTRGSSLDLDTDRASEAEIRLAQGDVSAETPISSLAPDTLTGDETAPTQLPFTPPTRKPSARSASDEYAATMKHTSAVSEPYNAGAARAAMGNMPSTLRTGAPTSYPSAQPPAYGGYGPGVPTPQSVPLTGVVPAPENGRKWMVLAAALVAVASVIALFAVLMSRGGAGKTPVSILVTSTPPGARVYMDNQLQEGRTPFHKAVLTGEQHTFSVALEGLPEVSPKTVRPDDGTAITVHFDLGPATPKSGKINIDPNPPEARVWVDGVDRGPGRQTLNDLPLGRDLLLRVEAPGYKPAEQRVRLTEDAAEIDVPITLSKAAALDGRTRKIRLLTRPQRRVEVFMDGRSLGFTPKVAILPVGEVELRIVNESLKLDRIIRVVVLPDGDKLEIPLP